MPMKIGETMPTFEGATGWLNELPETIEGYTAGSSVLVYFWATSCGICKTKMPQLNELKEKYRELKTVAVHMPRYEADTNLETVKETMQQHNIKDVCAIDNQHKLKNAFQNEQGWVPVYYLFDAEGKLKTRAAGEFGIGVLKTALEKMFPENAMSATA